MGRKYKTTITDVNYFLTELFVPSADVMCLSRYRGDFQVVADVHSVHLFLWDRVRAVQVSQQACWLKANKT